MARIVLAMSGGVDSSVAAALLKQQGHDVIGLFMRTGSHAETGERQSKTCCSIADSLDARAVADALDIPFFALDFEKEFGRKAKTEMLPMQPGDVPATYADIEDLKREVGFSPSTSIEDGIARFAAWYRDYHQL